MFGPLYDLKSSTCTEQKTTPETLYEAIALGMAAIRTDDWVAGNVAVEHEVKIMDFKKWLDRDGGSPRILGVENSNTRSDKLHK
jgi:hypothetical protein